jgi:hypothetical protein
MGESAPFAAKQYQLVESALFYDDYEHYEAQMRPPKAEKPNRHSR